MPKRKLSRLNPAVNHVVVSGDTVITPPFFHLDLARSKDHNVNSIGADIMATANSTGAKAPTQPLTFEKACNLPRTLRRSISIRSKP